MTDHSFFFNENLNVNNDIKLLSDDAVIHFGADKDITLTHQADTGLILKNTQTADDKPIILTLQTGETDIQADDVIGAINFQAPDESTGTDAILVCAGIAAVSEGDFAGDSNATKLSFKVGSSEVASEKMALSSGGNLTLSSGNLTLSTGNLIISSGSLTLGDTAVTSSAAELNILTGKTFNDSVTLGTSTTKIASESIIKSYVDSVATGVTASADTDFTGDITFSGIIYQTRQNAVITGTADVNLAKSLLYLTTTGTGGTEHAVTLKDSSGNKSWTDGHTLHIFFSCEDSTPDTIKLEISDTTSPTPVGILVSGSGSSGKYLTFSNVGQAASLIYINSKWRIINTGAAVS